jgi:hypothetical protein
MWEQFIGIELAGVVMKLCAYGRWKGQLECRSNNGCPARDS